MLGPTFNCPFYGRTDRQNSVNSFQFSLVNHKNSLRLSLSLPTFFLLLLLSRKIRKIPGNHTLSSDGDLLVVVKRNRWEVAMCVCATPHLFLLFFGLRDDIVWEQQQQQYRPPPPPQLTFNGLFFFFFFFKLLMTGHGLFPPPLRSFIIYTYGFSIYSAAVQFFFFSQPKKN